MKDGGAEDVIHVKLGRVRDSMAISLPATTQLYGTDGIIRFIGTLPETKNGKVYVFLIVDLFSRHAEGYAMTKDKKTARGCASDLAGNEEW